MASSTTAGIVENLFLGAIKEHSGALGSVAPAEFL
jgi:hypothetical protein